MNNGWLKVAMFSFIGIMFSIFALALVSNFVPASDHNGMAHQMDQNSYQQHAISSPYPLTQKQPMQYYQQQPMLYPEQGYQPYQMQYNETLLLKTQIYELRLKVMQLQYLLQQQQIQNNMQTQPANPNSANMGMSMM